MPSQSEAQRRKMAVLHKQCEQCGAEFSVDYPSRLKTRRFCSRACSVAHRASIGDLTHVSSVPRQCRHCGEAFLPQGNSQRYCKDCIPDEISRRRLMKYGVSGERWLEMLAEQEGKCALCDAPAVHQDHDHATGAYRRPLCVACNIALGRVETTGWLVKVVEYLAVSEQESESKDVFAV